MSAPKVMSGSKLIRESQFGSAFYPRTTTIIVKDFKSVIKRERETVINGVVIKSTHSW